MAMSRFLLWLSLGTTMFLWHTGAADAVDADAAAANNLRAGGRGLSEYGGQGSSTGQEAERPAIVTLITTRTDLSELCNTFKTLSHLKGDLHAPILIFDAFGITKGQAEALEHCVHNHEREVWRHHVDFGAFPPGLTDHLTEMNPGEYDWSNEQRHRFWSTLVWQHAAIQQHDVVLRIEDETCFTIDSSYLPDFSLPSKVYHAEVQYDANTFNAISAEGTSAKALLDFAQDFVRKFDIEPANPKMWQMVLDQYEQYGSLPIFETSFEVLSVRFMTRPEIMAWHEALTEHEPFGYFQTHGWRVDHERFLTMALFAQEEEIDTRSIIGYMEKDFASGHLHPKVCGVSDIQTGE